MSACFSKQIPVIRLIALCCLAALLVASLVAPLHKHDSGQESTCLICHVTHRGNVVAIDSDVGKPLTASSNQIRIFASEPSAFDAPDLTRGPRPPPSLLLSL